MSCHIIFYQNGAKMMRPVMSAGEYMSLRGSERQKALVESVRKGNEKAKFLLLQMNYSCIPGGNVNVNENANANANANVDANENATPIINGCGPLKGCRTPSDTVGMDVDHIQPSEMAEVRERILGKKEELGLLMLERSARGCGYHLVFRRKFMEGLSEGRVLENQEANLRWASELLGVRYDEGAKDITRVFFTTTASEEDLLFLDEGLFEAKAMEVTSEVGVPEVKTEAQEIEATVEVGKGVIQKDSALPVQKEPTSEQRYLGIPYPEIIGKYWELFNEGNQPTEGNRNVLTYELAMSLRPICDYSLEKLLEVIPNYWAGQDGTVSKEAEEEWRRTIQSALKEPRKGMPYRMRQVLKAVGTDRKMAATGGTQSTPPPMPRKLPKVLELLTSKAPAMYRGAIAEAVFPALGVHLHGVKFRYWDNVEHEPTFMNVLIAPMSIGKGSIKKPIDYIMADIKEADKPNRLREAEWKRKNPMGKAKAKDPRPTDICIQMLVDNLTDAVFNQRVVDANENGQRFIYTRVDEVEQLKKVTSRGTVDEVSILIRKAYDNAEHGQERVGADSVTGIAPLRWNFNASTTIPNALRFFRGAVNDGTLSRLCLSTILKPGQGEEDGRVAEAPVFGIYDERFAEQLKPYIDRLNAASGLVECPQALKLARELTRENEERATLYESEGYRVLSFRGNVTAFLKGMVLYIAQGYRWSKEIEEYVRWSEQMDLWCKMRFFGSQLEDELRAETRLVNASPQNLLALLPDEFTQDEFISLRREQGRAGDGKNTLRKWKQRGYIEYDEISDSWRKVSKELVA